MTEKLYYIDSYLRQFQANILSQIQAENGYEVVLDRTAFYPTSGGQPHDLGNLQASSVRNVYENDQGEIIHSVDKPVETGTVECQVDWSRRFDHMQQHTGQHVLSQAFLRTSKLNTMGFHLGADYVTIDLEAENISSEQLHQAEDLANSIVFENRPTKVRIASTEEVPHLGLRKESQREGPLRVVEVEGFDVSACGGTHVKHTGEIGQIFIRKSERVNRQARIEFVCGQRALLAHRSGIQNLTSIAHQFSVGLDEAPERVAKQIQEAKELLKLLQNKNKTLAGLLAKDLYDRAVMQQGFKLIKQCLEGEEMEFLKRLAQSILAQGESVVLLGTKGNPSLLLLAESESLRWDLRQVLPECCKLIEGKGGGSRTLVQAGGKASEKLQAALDFAVSWLLP